MARRAYHDLYHQWPDIDDCTDADLRALRAQGVRLAQFVREPYSRFVSTYCFFYERFSRLAHFPASKEMHAWWARRDRTIDAFLRDAIREFPHDKHIAPQYTTHGVEADFVWPLDDAEIGWAILRKQHPLLPPLPSNQSNQDTSTGGTLCLRSQIQFAQIYRQDIGWYASVRSNSAKIRAT